MPSVSILTTIGDGQLRIPKISSWSPLASRRQENGSHTGGYQILQTDAFEWLRLAQKNSIHAVVTDPPYGLIEYSASELEKRRKGKGGVWRIPPTFDGSRRKPLPRFTVLTADDRRALRKFFENFAATLMPVLVPGAHVFIATNPLVSYLVYEPMIAAGFEKRGEIIRVIHTLRGGDRPKNAHDEFTQVSVMPRSCWEPWGLFRKPCEGRVQDNLRKWKTGGLRRISASTPFKDLIYSSPARGREREIAEHPSLKPQHFMRQIVRASLPLGTGVIIDPFMGSGSTIAAACACGLASIGLENNPQYYRMAEKAIPALAKLGLDNAGGGRTHTFGVKSPAKKLAGKAVYKRQDIVLRDGKPVPAKGSSDT